ncbi:hypothetical protein [Cephaloticoccus primus]|uniref:hypothetical protein n=1 Tax=Cephaloticoccus primus TaxID=1548207 RepID=UPI0012E7FB2F|nr:hypothetical protein [Cephaloticoccus primus]
MSRTDTPASGSHLPTPGRAEKTRGFALVLVLSLLSILVVVIYAISLIGRVDGEIGATDSYHLQARQNALLGMRLALAELQRTAGDSSAITAPASIRRRSSSTPAYPQLLGVWAAGSSTAVPTNWFVSGNFEAAGPRQITPDSLLTAATAITLVGRGTVLAERDMGRAHRVPIGDTQGGYAFWIGDQGAKAALAVAAERAPLAPNGRALLSDPRRDISGFAHHSPQRGQPLIWDDLSYLIGSTTNMKPRFRSYSAKSYWAEGGVLRAGLFNVNTSDPISWEAVLRAYEHARDVDAPALTESDARFLAEQIAANLGPKQAPGKPQYGPFFSIAAFWDSELVQESLEAAGITELTQDELRNVLWPMLRVRSDTFLIRAYGDARNPASAAGALGSRAAAVAYCEVLVQRSPQPDPLGSGQRFTPLYFRWLLPEEI